MPNSDHFRVSLDIAPSTEAYYKSSNLTGLVNETVDTKPHVMYIPASSLLDKAFFDNNYFNKIETLFEAVEYFSFANDILFRQDCYSDRQIEFIKDTLKFLKTGERDTPLEVWKTLAGDNTRYLDQGTRMSIHSLLSQIAELAGVRKSGPMTPDYSRETSYEPMSPTEYGMYITMWCTHKGGLRDFIFSIWFLSTY